jgi:hypothetical protein
MPAMTTERGAANIPDILIGATLLLLLPLAALAFKGPGGVPEDGAPKIPANAPLTATELGICRSEYSRMHDTARNFMVQARFDADHGDQYRGWARAALQKAKMGVEETLARAKAAPEAPELESPMKELEELLRKVTATLKELSTGGGAPPAQEGVPG